MKNVSTSKNCISWSFDLERNSGKPSINLTVDGSNLTWFRPADHPWHRSLWFSWKFINGVNFWEEDAESEISDGRTEIVRNSEDEEGSSFSINYVYRDRTLVSEERKVTYSSIDDIQQIEWFSEFATEEDVVELSASPIEGQTEGVPWGGYAGLSLRFSREFTDWDVTNSSGDKNEASHGKKSRWICFSGKLNGGQCSVLILDHEKNPEFPTPFYVWMDKSVPFAYVSPALLFGKNLKLKNGETLKLHYRIFVIKGSFESGTIETLWADYNRV